MRKVFYQKKQPPAYISLLLLLCSFLFRTKFQQEALEATPALHFDLDTAVTFLFLVPTELYPLQSESHSETAKNRL